MSHFTVTVRLSAKRLRDHEGDIDDALAEIMAPFEESPEDGSEFLTFCDKTEEVEKEYATGTSKRVKTPQGELLSPWDERFRVKGEFGIGSGTYAVPVDCVEVEVPWKEIHATVDAFAEEYHGYERNAAGRFGYLHNENAKWDWFSIGGRWSGHFPLKAGKLPVVGKPGAFDNKPEDGCGDVCRVGDIDMDKVATMTRERADKFFAEWTEYVLVVREGRKVERETRSRDHGVAPSTTVSVASSREPSL